MLWLVWVVRAEMCLVKYQHGLETRGKLCWLWSKWRSPRGSGHFKDNCASAVSSDFRRPLLFGGERRKGKLIWPIISTSLVSTSKPTYSPRPHAGPVWRRMYTFCTPHLHGFLPWSISSSLSALEILGAGRSASWTFWEAVFNEPLGRKYSQDPLRMFRRPQTSSLGHPQFLPHRTIFPHAQTNLYCPEGLHHHRSQIHLLGYEYPLGVKVSQLGRHYWGGLLSVGEPARSRALNLSAHHLLIESHLVWLLVWHKEGFSIHLD